MLDAKIFTQIALNYYYLYQRVVTMIEMPKPVKLNSFFVCPSHTICYKKLFRIMQCAHIFVFYTELKVNKTHLFK